MEAIKKTFETDTWITNQLRSIGMNLAQNSSGIK
jgi:predicted ATP-dependent Lon-type protease